MVERRSVQFGATTIAFAVVRSKRRRKTISIRLDPAEGVLVSAPMRTQGDEIDRLVNRRAGWITRKSTEAMLRPQPKQFVSGESLPYLGRQVRIFVLQEPPSTAGTRASVTFDHWSFRVTVPVGVSGEARRRSISMAFTKWYKARAEERLRGRVSIWSDRLGRAPARVLVRDQRQRWGSCSPEGVLRFNWRIVMAEPALMDYVVVHELLHLSVRNHGSEFWGAMAASMPDYRIRRARLKEFGQTLVL